MTVLMQVRVSEDVHHRFKERKLRFIFYNVAFVCFKLGAWIFSGDLIRVRFITQTLQGFSPKYAKISLPVKHILAFSPFTKVVNIPTT